MSTRRALLDLTCQLRAHPGIFLAGQMTGVEGYLESAAIGILTGLNAHRRNRGLETRPFRRRRRCSARSVTIWWMTEPEAFCADELQLGHRAGTFWPPHP